MKKKISVFILVIALVLFDQITKYLVSSQLTLGKSIELIPGFFSLTYVCNTGSAWSLLAGKTTFFYIITVFALVLFVYWYLHSENKLEKIGVLLMIAGTIGNFLDRLRFKHVIDFLDFIIFGYDFPVFNIADCQLVIGVGLVLIYILFFDKKGQHE